jgi:hypothetical protein
MVAEIETGKYRGHDSSDPDYNSYLWGMGIIKETHPGVSDEEAERILRGILAYMQRTGRMPTD